MLQRCLLVLAIMFLGYIAGNSAQAQYYANAETDFGLNYFPKESRDFQGNSFSRGSIHLGYISASDSIGVDLLLGLGMTRHLKSNSKVNGNPLQSEATKVIEFQRDLMLSVRFLRSWGEVKLGAWIGRHSVHWLDRDCECFFNSFPRDHKSAKEVLDQLRSKKRFPGIAYHDGLRPAVRVILSQMNTSFLIQGPAYRWHNVTLPYHGWSVYIEHARENIFSGKIKSGLRSEFGGLMEFTADGFIHYYPISAIGLGVRYGRIPYPGYLRPLHRFSVSLQIDLSFNHE